MSITTKLIGRCGNQMFQIANVIAYSLRHKMDYEIPQSSENPELWPAYFSHFPATTKSLGNWAWYHETDHSYKEIPRGELFCFNGYYQSYKYFWDYKDQVIDAFQPAFKEFNEANVAQDSWKDVVSIHVRRGDYVNLETKHPVVTLDYIKKAVAYFIELEYNTFAVYSDDVQWCKENINGSNINTSARFIYPKNKFTDDVKKSLYDLWSMSQCGHNIISNSTFSYWAAMINKNEHKIVVSPSVDNWFGSENKHLDVKDLLPPDWIQIKY